MSSFPDDLPEFDGSGFDGSGSDLPAFGGPELDDFDLLNTNQVDLGSLDLGSLDLASETVNALPVSPQSLPLQPQQKTSSAKSVALNPVPVLVSAPVDQASAEEAESNLSSNLARRVLWTAVPAWLISMLVHVCLLFIMAAVSWEPISKALAVVMTADPTETDVDALEEFEISAAQEVSVDESEVVPDSMPQVQVVVSQVSPDVALEVEVDNTLAKLASESLSDQLAPDSLMSAQMDVMQQILGSRSAVQKRDLLEKYGGNAKSEKAVAQALRWLSEHQLPDGSWSFLHTAACRGECDSPGNKVKARNGATGLALLPFLGAGQTHMEGEYKTTVYRGLEFLIKSMDSTPQAGPGGSWYTGDDQLYGHGIAAIAMCEAYAMTKDPVLAGPAQKSIGYIAFAQNPVLGGWQYNPQEGGDTSVAGWQIMAMKSAAMGGLVVPIETLRKADYFLNRVQMNDGAFYGYDQPTTDLEGRKATTACGLLCRMYMGWPKTHPALNEGVQWISKRGPDGGDMYYNYYATQVLKQFGGETWENWNRVMRDQLVDTQVSTGHAVGSWYYPAPELQSGTGGRLYFTCMAAMTLEVYYRFLPIYSDEAEEDSFKL